MSAPAWASGYVGIPYRAKGRGHDGADCWGLVRLVLEEQFGIGVPSYGDEYPDAFDRTEIARLISGELGPWRAVPAGQEQAGDGVLLRILGRPCHVGIVVTPGVMLHVEEGINAALERYDSPKWARRIIGIHRHVG